MLSPYRVLDLTNERGLLAGKLLADLGADVIQVEPPAGSSARRVGPFFAEGDALERSAHWAAYAANKRGITLDLSRDRGRALLRTRIGSGRQRPRRCPDRHRGARCRSHGER